MAADLGSAAFSSIVSEGAKALFESIKRQISYVFKYQSYVDELKDQVKQLGYKREMVQQPVNHARLQGDELYEGVTNWLHSVDEFISEGVAKSIIDDENGAKKSCFKGLCPNLLSRYKLSKKAEKAAKDAADLVGKGNFTSVSYRPAPKSTEYMQVKDYEAFDSRMKVFQDVMEALKDDKLNIIGVYGMGGVGKTTLVKQVAKKVMEDKLFDKVVMAEVTETPDYQEIQKKLAFDLGMKFGSDENKFETAYRLRERLKKEKRVLIILDNIWTKLELDIVGIPSGDVAEKDRKCTIILTSREQDLLRTDMNSQKNFPIDALPRKEALQLFEKIVDDSTKISAFQPIPNEIVERCGGLPVALSTVANALKTKEREFWKDALNQLRRSDAREIHGMQANVYTSIKLSYDFLESEEAKSLFRLCALYSEGHAIWVSDLLRYGVGWGLFENVYTLEEARSRVHRLIDNLKSSCLLLDGDAEDKVKMHDVIHVVAVSIAAEKRMFNIPNVADVEKKMEETIQKDPIAISLPHRDIQELPERLQCPNLQLFLLFGNGYDFMQVSDYFFEGTEGLKVLNFTGIHFSSLPSSLGRLINLQTLCLDCDGLEDIAIVGELKNLEILSLARSDIEQLPLEIGQLKRLQLLDLRYCDELEMIIGADMEKPTTTQGCKEITAEDDHIHKFIFPHLEELELDGLRNIEKLWPDQFQGMYCCQNLAKVTVWCCGRLKYLFSYSMANSLGQLQHLEIRHCWSMEGVVNTSGGLGGRDELKVFPKLQSLRLEGLQELSSFASPEDVIHTEMQPQPLFDEKVQLPSLEVLCIKSMDKLIKIWHHQLASESFSKLKKLEIKECPNLLNIFPPLVRLPSLEELHIRWMFNLRKIWHCQLALDSSSKLKNLEITKCDNLLNIFPPLVGIPSSLVNLNVRNCLKLEEIVGHVGEEVKENRIAFSKLKILILDYLPRLTSFCLENYTLEFPSLEQASVTHCPSMKTFSQGILSTPKLYEVEVTKLRPWEGNLNSTIQKCYEEMVGFRDLFSLKLSDFPRLRELWHGPALPVGFFNDLRSLVVDDCKNMLSAIPANLLRYLNNLRDLEVRNCDSVEEVFHLDELNSEEEHFGPLFPQLWELKIMNLPKLKRFCNFTENIIELPQLNILTIENCPNMETFVSNLTSVLHVTTDNKEPQKLTSEENFLLADQMKPLFDEKVSFPQLKWLELSRLPNVLHLWKENAKSNKVFVNLQSLIISECTKLQNLVPSSWRLENLGELEVSKCHGLINVLTLLTSKSLVNLWRMKIADCKMIEEIIQLQVGEEVKGCIVFEEMNYLTLDCLPSLTSFCLGNYALKFPSLERVVVIQCPRMKIFSQGVVDTPKLNKVKLTEEYDDDDEGCWEGNLNYTIQFNLNDTIHKLFNEMNSKDKIEPTLQAQ